ncbi:serine/threonine protein kinase [Blastomyces parvus]|uniref:Serine/threonine protein kinase n=1 Tax=Blastomyces parvus TaxID=2060905 RepID=A0A2B7XEY8_9EURO|nr:serine/threonine protein kinase [Blastomyces parvus]
MSRQGSPSESSCFSDMATVSMLGQTLKGMRGLYTVNKQLHECVWLAAKTNVIRPLLDEIQDPSTPPTIVLRHLDDDILHASDMKRLTRQEVKYVARKVLEALSVLHEEGFVHTDIKPSNVLVNYGENNGDRFAEVQLADLGSTVHKDSGHARDGDPIGTPIFRSPEAHLSISWDTATDIWSFGAMVISLLYGRGFHIFKPNIPIDHEDYEIKILMKHYQCFGPFPKSYVEIADDPRLQAIIWVMDNCPPDTLKPFHLTTSREICQEDKEFVLKMMKLDPRDRPTSQELLADQWFHQT